MEYLKGLHKYPI